MPRLDAGARGSAFVNCTKDEPDGDRNGGHDDPADDRGDRRGSGREGNDEVDHSGDEARDHNSGHGGIDLHGDSPSSPRYLSLHAGYCASITAKGTTVAHSPTYSL